MDRFREIRVWQLGVMIDRDNWHRLWLRAEHLLATVSTLDPPCLGLLGLDIMHDA